MKEVVARCSRCKVEKPHGEFYKASEKRGPQAYCKPCIREYKRERHAERIETDESYRARRKAERTAWRLHRLNEEEYRSMVLRAEGMCEICQVEKIETVDHRHDTCHPGTYGCPKCVRGVLCQRCNKMLGMAQDNVEYLKRAVEYLNNRQAT